MDGFSHESQRSKTVEWYTPKWIFDALGMQFDLDPAAPPGGVRWIPAHNHYSMKENGLLQQWGVVVWLNPPYGKETSRWLVRMHTHRNGVALVFARTDCTWFHDYVAKADAILFLKGRVKFVDSDNKTGNSGAGAGSMLVGWGDSAVAALSTMRGFGLLTMCS